MSHCNAFLASIFPSISTPEIKTSSFSGSRTTVLVQSSLVPLAIALALSSSPLPCLAIPSPSSKSSLLPFNTPYAQSQSLKVGLENGKIRPCPSTNPSCISTNPQSPSSEFPWVVPENSSDNAIWRLRDAIMKTQTNVKIQVEEDTPNGYYLQAEVDGGLGRDLMEFLVKRDVVAYRSMATKVTYIYPFTTAFGDSEGQKQRVNKIKEELGWYSPNFESLD